MYKAAVRVYCTWRAANLSREQEKYAAITGTFDAFYLKALRHVRKCGFKIETLGGNHDERRGCILRR